MEANNYDWDEEIKSQFSKRDNKLSSNARFAL